ncbi:cyclohexanecarboxyl-CoA dehydrogenase [Rhodococcus opacus PD630]|uniref:acyl-CoA dehydrogenase family protein n=1 Tax=Rhodococcus TaxID=1827 RepID=UPI00029CCC82|nr:MULTISPECIES: acyl-CoA dehydrogenase family protein [Rhodococcus]KXF57101.1 cyclohexanecarboxyl-CoA dehydrogenase [Rhodococcus sp. SC4]AHK34587.1 putative acyl-CoA dehydrogenase YngJ [Rhodococcus opacus PD630]EHI39521.1 cyclohexanecarboxyl-CoA dehydrogenase [Rhodococcus opacus PD630]KXX56418.1 cyclohexanecarboxyl-CoA dehydrogenase [Rhodococcus sp. LB1]PBC56166.1 cyclohexanecarboxyl-CoA dehydrogenase [Rhodococcus sp. ACPA1]
MFEISDEQHALLTMVRQFVREQVRPLEDTLDPDATSVPAADYDRLVSKTKQMGLYNLDLPEKEGGPGIDLVTRCLLAIEMSQHRAGLYAPCFEAFGHTGQIPLLSAWATSYQREKYLEPSISGEKRACFALSEPTGGSDPGRNIRTKAVKDGNEWVLNGSKLWISFAHEAEFALVFARTGGPGRDGITCFIVDTDTPGFNVHRIVHTMRSTDPGTELQLENVRVPEENILGEIGKGFSLANERLSRNRIPYSAGTIGLAIRAQEMTIEWTKMRESFGKRLADHQGANWMLVENEQDIRQATLMVLNAAAAADADRPFRTEAALAKIAATEASFRVVDRCIQLHGGLGVSRELPLERWFRELRIRRIGEGATEIQKVIVGRDLINNPYQFFLTRK